MFTQYKAHFPLASTFTESFVAHCHIAKNSASLLPYFHAQRRSRPVQFHNMATSNTEKVIGLLFDELGFTDPSISPESDSNIASEVTIPLEQRAAIFARVEASMQTRKKAFFERHSSSESEKVEVIPKNIPQRNNRQQTEDRKLLGQQMEDPRLGGLTVDECKDLTEIFKAKLRTTVTNRTVCKHQPKQHKEAKLMMSSA